MTRQQHAPPADKVPPSFPSAPPSFPRVVLSSSRPLFLFVWFHELSLTHFVDSLFVFLFSHITCVGRFFDSRTRTCVNCSPGTASSADAAVTCSSCQPGFHAPTVKMTSCLPCPNGSYAPSPNADTCIPCSPGSAQSLQGQSSCVMCAPNTFQPGSGQDACLSCATPLDVNAHRTTCSGMTQSSLCVALSVLMATLQMRPLPSSLGHVV